MIAVAETGTPYDFVRPEHRRLLDDLLFLCPEAKRLFEEGRVASALDIIKKSRYGTVPMDKDAFLFIILNSMPSDLQYD